MVVAVVFESEGSGSVEALPACLADGFASAVVFVVGGDIADVFVESDRVVFDPDTFEFGLQLLRVVELFEVRVFVFEVPEERFDPCLVGWGVGPSVVLGDRHERHECTRVVRRHLWPVVRDGEQDRPVRVIDSEVKPVIGE